MVTTRSRTPALATQIIPDRQACTSTHEPPVAFSPDNAADDLSAGNARTTPIPQPLNGNTATSQDKSSHNENAKNSNTAENEMQPVDTPQFTPTPTKKDGGRLSPPLEEILRSNPSFHVRDLNTVEGNNVPAPIYAKSTENSQNCPIYNEGEDGLTAGAADMENIHQSVEEMSDASFVPPGRSEMAANAEVNLEEDMPSVYLRFPGVIWNSYENPVEEAPVGRKASKKGRGKGKNKRAGSAVVKEASKAPSTQVDDKGKKRSREETLPIQEIVADDAESARKKARSDENISNIDNDEFFDAQSSIPPESGQQKDNDHHTVHILSMRPEVTEPNIQESSYENRDNDTTGEQNNPQLQDQEPTSSPNTDTTLQRFPIFISDKTKETYRKLSAICTTDLADIEDAGGNDIPWTAERLTHLYIYSLEQGNADFCDLIADVWIRAFQELQRGRNEGRIWRHFKHHHQRHDILFGCGIPPAPAWQREDDLPILAGDVTQFDARLLNQLYAATPQNNGARMLWADAMALCGGRMEKSFKSWKEDGVELHEDLCFDVMQTALRMVRRRLTLIIEMVGSEDWCDRYHVHGKEALCFRAPQKRREKEQAKAAEEEDLHAQEDQMQLEDVLMELDDD